MKNYKRIQELNWRIWELNKEWDKIRFEKGTDYEQLMIYDLINDLKAEIRKLEVEEND